MEARKPVKPAPTLPGKDDGRGSQAATPVRRSWEWLSCRSMTAIEPQVYLNGQFVPRSQATMDIEDRGALFADGVYEVLRYFAGRPLVLEDHLQRLRLSMQAIRLTEPPWVTGLGHVSDELVRRNGLADATLYWQVTRGSAPRDHVFPKGATPTVLAIAYPAPSIEQAGQLAAVEAILHEDLRWHLCSIKSLMLLPNVLAKNRAVESGAREAILHRGNRITEGTSTSVFIVRSGELWTHPADQWILGGITRRLLIGLAPGLGVPVVERTYTVEQLLTADEVLICGTTTLVAAVVRVDGQPIGPGSVGPLTRQLHGAVVDYIKRNCCGG